MVSKITPIFLFSLPRSGSTMLQRIISSHKDVSTTSEPWLLLPFLYTLKEVGCYSEYRHHTMVQAIEDFCKELPGGIGDYLESIKSMILELYSKASDNNAKYFLDKTPRYHLISEQIIDLFPNAKIIFLWRNPISVVSSIVETFSSGRWILHNHKIDLFEGLNSLISAYTKNIERSISIRFEDLLFNPENTLKTLFKYLQLDFNEINASNMPQIYFKGRMGDKTGVREYKNIDREPLSKWKNTIISPVRKGWCRFYLKSIGKEKLGIIGYNLDDMILEIDRLPFDTKYFLSDLINLSRSFTICLLEWGIMKKKLKSLGNWNKLHVYGP